MGLRHIHNVTSVSLGIAVCATLLGGTCDPGISYSPTNWSRTDEVRFSKSFGLLDITLRPIGGLIGNKDITPEISISNRSKLPAIVEKAVLRANGLEHVAQPFGDTKWVTISSGDNRRIDIKWEFETYIDEILKDPVEIDLIIKLGDEETEVKIPMAKTFG
jgi:hypothetical protein